MADTIMTSWRVNKKLRRRAKKVARWKKMTESGYFSMRLEEAVARDEEEMRKEAGDEPPAR